MCVTSHPVRSGDAREAKADERVSSPAASWEKRTPGSPRDHVLLPEKRNVTQCGLYQGPLMEPALHSGPHCLGQDEKRGLLFRKAPLTSPPNHASSHACSPSSSVSEGVMGGVGAVSRSLASHGGSDIMWFTESWGDLQSC